MPVVWFAIGTVSTIAAIVVIYPWLRNVRRLPSLLGHRASAPLAAVLLAACMLAAYHWSGNSRSPAPAVTAQAGGFTSAAKTFADATGESAASASSAPQAASSMESAVASLEERLAKGGGTAGDWELLAKSFEFMGRPTEAAAARAHQLPDASGGEGAAVRSEGAAVRGEVTIAPALSAKAAAGDALFIIAKSINSPGPPLAVVRSAVGAWPVKFVLSDSQSMLPGRNLSSAGRVVVEARISLQGQPLPASGDLQGASVEIDPRDGRPLKILIDGVVP